ncbi:MAG: di-trans,poly-cis-decaprenylcistransferase, partial [Bacteroidales bacterium]|nr:di-trans,poly-cis-decaprenylcistransferase [Bacteroidales bacterium]
MSENGGVPVHVTIIMDGNGRWARQRGGERLMGHRNGVKSVRESCEFAVEKGIKYLSLYAFSEENWNRPKEEVEGLMALMVKSVLEERETFRKNNIRFRVIGHRERLSPDLLEKIDEAQAETAGNTGLTLIVMLSYSGKWDIVQAAARYAEDACAAARRGEAPKPLDEVLFSSYLC